MLWYVLWHVWWMFNAWYEWLCYWLMLKVIEMWWMINDECGNNANPIVVLGNDANPLWSLESRRLKWGRSSESHVSSEIVHRYYAPMVDSLCTGFLVKRLKMSKLKFNELWIYVMYILSICCLLYYWCVSIWCVWLRLI